MADEKTVEDPNALFAVADEAPVDGPVDDATAASEAPIEGEPLPGGPTETSPADLEAPTSYTELTPAIEEQNVVPEAETAPVGGEAEAAPAAEPAAPTDELGAAPVGEEAETVTAPDQAALLSDEASKLSDAEEPAVKEAPAALPNTGDVVEEGYPLPAPDAPSIHPVTLEPMVGDGLGEDAGKVADVELPKADELNIPKSEPADIAGAPNSGTPINLPDTSIDLSGGYPAAVDAPAVHPQTQMPLINDGVGEDAGKVAELPTTDDGRGVVDFPLSAAKDHSEEVASAPAEADAPVPAPEPEHKNSCVKKLEHKVAKVLEKLGDLEAMMKRLLGELL